MEIDLEFRTWSVGDALVDGKGGFGKVFNVRDEDGSEAVAKFVPKAPGAERELLMGDSTKASQFRNVIPVIDKGEHDGQWVLVMPKADRSLAQYMSTHKNTLDLVEIVAILQDIATALSDISGDIVHRDIKPPNILRLDEKWNLADFGIARYLDATTAVDTRKFALSAPYAAPEQWRFERATSATDIYSFGVIAYQLIAGSLPFYGPDFRQQHLTETPPKLTNGTARLRTLVEECLFKAPDARPTAANVLARLNKVAEEPNKPGATRLAQVNQAEIERRSAKQVEAVRQQHRDERFEAMFEVARQSFETVSSSLLEALEDNAPAAKFDTNSNNWGMLFVVQLGDAKLGLSKPEKVKHWNGPFEVFACSVISVNLSRANQHGRQGRSHSLWFGDIQEKGRFAWYEVAFWGGAFSNHVSPIEPFSCTPQEAQSAFRGGIGTGPQLALPFEEVDRSDPSAFIDRWIGWFASAVEGQIYQTSMMPEKNPRGSWRQAP